MWSVIYESLQAAWHMIFGEDRPLISKEVRNWLSNPDDAKLYRNACDRSRNGERNVSVTFSDGKTITLI